jgi:hexosaminidase
MIPLPAVSQPPIIPLPQKFEKTAGIFRLQNNLILSIDDESLRDEAWYLQKELLRLKNLVTFIRTAPATKTGIRLLKDKDKKLIQGAYRIRITPGLITISSASDEGVFNGISSLLQLATAGSSLSTEKAIECWQIDDAPQFAWRGLMLDESRHFFGMTKVKSLLDWMAFYKLNKFHWHLTDAPGWRIQIKKYPWLTLVGGIGNHNDSLAAATYYTQEEIKEIVAYAAERKIEVIPEIDMPGHARAANRAYPQFSGGGSAKYPDFTFDPGNPGTYGYLTDILREVNVLFNSGMIHLGGDEVSFGNEKWHSNPAIKKLMEKNQLKNLKQVEEYFMRRMADSLFSMNSRFLAWDEMAEVDLPVGKTIIFWWRHDKPAQLQKALENNYAVVLCPRIPFYFDFVQDSAHKVGRKWSGRYAGPQEVYGFDPLNSVAENKRSLILGMQANLWTEQIGSSERLDYMTFPRIAALAETTWSGQKNYDNFLERLKGQLSLYRQAGLYFYNPFAPAGTPEPGF